MFYWTDLHPSLPSNKGHEQLLQSLKSLFWFPELRHCTYIILDVNRNPSFSTTHSNTHGYLLAIVYTHRSDPNSKPSDLLKSSLSFGITTTSIHHSILNPCFDRSFHPLSWNVAALKTLHFFDPLNDDCFFFYTPHDSIIFLIPYCYLKTTSSSKRLAFFKFNASDSFSSQFCDCHLWTTCLLPPFMQRPGLVSSTAMIFQVCLMQMDWNI